MEWSNANQLNSFNSLKGLAYFEHYKKIVAWMDGKGELPPPIECNLDPYAECQLACKFCITQRYLRTHREEVGEMRKLPTEYMYRLVDFLAGWGVVGLCTSGGGEPMLHKGVPEIIIHAVVKGMKTSLFTNAVSISPPMAEAIMLCQWISLSVDASDREMYQIIKGADRYDDVLRNIKALADLRRRVNSQVNLTVNYLVLPENYTKLYEACKIAKELGVQTIHFRPADLERTDVMGKKINIDMDVVQEQFARCQEENTADFRVFTITHKFDNEFHVKHDFTQCLATPLLIPILTDGNAYMCVDRKMEKDFMIGGCFPNPENILKWWGSDNHRALIKGVEINRCSRCTFSQYHHQIEEVVLKDGMCLSFP